MAGGRLPEDVAWKRKSCSSLALLRKSSPGYSRAGLFGRIISLSGPRV